MIVSENTIQAVTELIKKCFEENRAFDRMVSVLGVDFACSNSAELIHKNIAHAFPALADDFGARCLERYNISVKYGATPAAEENYNSVEEIIARMKARSIEFQIAIMGACKISCDNNDIHVYSDLIEILRGYNNIVEQLILLHDKIKAYGSNAMAFDHDISTFWILGDR